MKLLNAFLNALYPANTACCVCNRDALTDGHSACENCRAQLEICPTLSPVPYSADAAAGLVYNDAAESMIHRFKYYGARYLAAPLASFIALPSQWQAEVILPVPLYPAREKARGYNQSLLLARELGKTLEIPVRRSLLRRVRDTNSQAGTLGAARAENVRGAFTASKDCAGLSILLVDDVITTGSTAAECARTLMEAGAASVYVAAVCAAKLTAYNN